MAQKGGAKVRGRFHVKHDKEKMMIEEERIKTFKTWSKTCPVKLGPLAKAGFYYVGILDRVQCFSCGGTVDNWRKGHTAMGRHEELYPYCDMVKNNETRNVPFKRSIKSSEVTETDGQAIFEDRITRKLMTPEDFVDAFCGTSFTGRLTRAKYPLLKDELRRIDTFRDKWSEDFKMAASETRWLANAGFFREGPNDRAECFFCGGKIESWEEDDEPWSEHARNFPTCEWLIEMKGKVFVDEVQIAKKAEEAEEKKLKENSADSPPTPVLEATSTSEYAIASKTAKIMESPTVKVIQDTGFDQRLIRRMIEGWLRGPGLDLSSSDNFIRTLWAAEGQVDSPGKTSTIDKQINRFANIQISDGPEHIPPSATASTPGHQQGLVLGRTQCLICKSNDTSTQFLPCSHEVACLQCARVALTCPQCATPIKTCRRISEIL